MAYVHKKFKKYAASSDQDEEKETTEKAAPSPGPSTNPGASPGPSTDAGTSAPSLKHGIGSIVGGGASSEPLYRQYYCDVCRIAFRVKSNLEKHMQKR